MPMLRVVWARSARAILLGWYESRLAAARTAFLALGEQRPDPVRTREAVEIETPAAAATSRSCTTRVAFSVLTGPMFVEDRLLCNRSRVPVRHNPHARRVRARRDKAGRWSSSKAYERPEPCDDSIRIAPFPRRTSGRSSRRPPRRPRAATARWRDGSW